MNDDGSVETTEALFFFFFFFVEIEKRGVCTVTLDSSVLLGGKQ